MCISLFLLKSSIHAAVIEGPRFKTAEDMSNSLKNSQLWAGLFVGCVQQAVIMRTTLDLEAMQKPTGALIGLQWPCLLAIACRMLYQSKRRIHELTRINTTSARMVFNQIWPLSSSRLTLDERQEEFAAFYAGYHAMRTAELPLYMEDAHLICSTYNNLLLEHVKDLHFASGYAVAAALGPPVGYLILQLMGPDAAAWQ
jgi:hypothetical protein